MNKIIRKYIFFLLVSLLFVQSASAAVTYLVTDHEPVYPGDTVFVWVPVKSIGYGTWLSDTVVKLVPANNATEKAVHVLDDAAAIGNIEDWNEVRTAKFKVHIDKNAVEGEYDFHVHIISKGKSDSSGSLATTTMQEDRILVVSGTPVITLSNSSIGSVPPGSSNEIVLKFRNEGTGTARNLYVDINTAMEHVTNVFSIVGSGTRFFIGSLGPGDEADIRFTLLVDSQAQTGVYNIPLKISGMNYSASDSIGMGVAGITDFELSYQESGNSFLLSVSNIGVNPAKAVSVEIPTQNSFSVTGSNTQVIGNLNSGDYTSANFQVSQTGRADMAIKILYTDAAGVRRLIEKKLPVKLSGGMAGATSKDTSDQHAAMHGGESNISKQAISYAPYLGIVLLGIIGFWQRKSVAGMYQRLKFQRQRRK
ncbi:MAG: hypothetical protein OIN89_06915 [Candidatus Methanoperedens sp.]|jgi:hypothetical protein|nr:hypothetical protein [Candidatus Methanoperedens sp.]PKL53643.1 MAG: hypothetical protein CVV36_05980 [Candidatus Methanoperedenaceae archaeon HGW-Methanoperedenaceae-1]